MNKMLILSSLALLPACAELMEGPRYVPYSADRFYVRSAPSSSDDQVKEMAQAACQKAGKAPQLQKSEQYNTFDVRDDTYDCVRR